MIPAKIISFEEAAKLGLTEKEKGSGVAVAAGFVASGKNGEKGEIIEKTLIKDDGTKELLFMHEDRKKEMEKRGHLKNYLNQFDTIEGESKETFFKKHLNIKENS